MSKKDEIRSAWVAKHPDNVAAEGVVNAVRTKLDAVKWSPDPVAYFKSRDSLQGDLAAAEEARAKVER